MATPLRHIIHLYNRAGFGISYADAKELKDKSIKEIVDGLFSNSSLGTYISLIKKEDIPRVREALKEGMTRQELNKLIREKTQELNLTWFKQLLTSSNLVREKQTLFWHNHFACRSRNPFFLQELNNIHRRYAFANFRTLLVEVTKSPAMLDFLNNQSNRKEHPNENFARELLELFTLGRGNYSEADIQEASRAFTGWAYSRDTFEFEFREKVHDFDGKTFLNRKGNFGGEDIINILMDQKQTAYFICKKIYKYYVNENVNEELVKKLSEYYYFQQYNTEMLLKTIFTSDWFYSEANMGSNIKTPVELLVGLSRQFKVKYGNERLLFLLQGQLGQTLFLPPNVAGWPGGKNWIDSSTLMLRMRIPSLVLNDGVIECPERVDDPENLSPPSPQTEQVNEKFNTQVDWERVLSEHENLEISNLSRAFLAKQPAEQLLLTINAEAANDLKERIIKLVSLPEYSLC